MKVCRYYDPHSKGAGLGLVYQGRVYNLSELDPDSYSSITSFLSLPNQFEKLTKDLETALRSDGLLYEDLDVRPSSDRPHLLAPLDRQEVWAAGVTYYRSKTARMRESETAATHYDLVYEAQRPELFFKATPHRTVGPNAPVRIRDDSQWNVPEPELTLVLGPDLRLVGYTIGNDMSSRDIEGENPLYLPQAKVYLQCAAIGPVITLAESVPDPGSLSIALNIERGGETVFGDQTNTSQIKRKFSELIDYLGRDNSFPEGVLLMTGTGIVPEDDFTLLPGDLVSISIEGLGTLRNIVRQGPGH